MTFLSIDLAGIPDGGACAETDPEAFHPEKGGTTKPAKQVCAVCDVRVECLEGALARGERFGIWGGLSERERRKLAPNGDPLPIVRPVPTDPRVCALDECKELLPRGSHARRMYCTREHKQVAAQRRLTVRFEASQVAS